MPLRTPLDVIEGIYLGQVVLFLHSSGIFDRLSMATDIAILAVDMEADEELLVALVDFVHQNSDILLRNRSGAYQVNPKYQTYVQFGFHFDKFLGAYGPALGRLDELLYSPALGTSLVDSNALAHAFSHLTTSHATPVAHILRGWGVSSLLDLGCGPANLLLEMGIADKDFRGVGVDANPAMCDTARRRIAEADLTNRVQVLEIDVRELASHVPPDTVGSIGALHGASIINEFFRGGSQQATMFVSELKELFPGRLLFVVDYYGKLSRVKARIPQYRHTLLHDLAQVISGQGIPPASLEGWAAVYAAADCPILHAYEGDDNGIQWFVHVVQL